MNVHYIPSISTFFCLSICLVTAGCQNWVPLRPSHVKNQKMEMMQTMGESHDVPIVGMLDKPDDASYGLASAYQTTPVPAQMNAHDNVQSQPTIPSIDVPMSIERATEYLLTHSHKLRAEQAGLRAKRLQAEALDSLHQPAVFLNGSAGRYNVETDISTDALRERIRHSGDNLSAQLSALGAQLPGGLGNLLSGLPSAGGLADKIPSSVNLARQDNFFKVSVAALMPIYNGGRIEAVQKFAQGRADVQASEVAETEEALQMKLVERYFLVQLTKQVVKVRKEAYAAVKAHDHAAQRMLDVGLISKAQRLQGTAALADARFQLKKSHDDLRLSQSAFASLLQSRDFNPNTPLFVNHHVLGSLSNFQTHAQAHHPAFAKIQAKSKQAQAVKSINDASWKPSVSAFGAHELSNGADDWIVGLSARLVLNNPVDRRKMQQAAVATLAQIRAVEQQAQGDIDLLVEKSWLTVADAVAHFDALAEQETLAREVLRFKMAGFREGLSTVIEVNDAEATLTKTRTKRVKAAYDYVVALAVLLTTTGEFERFAEISNSADIRLN